MKRSIHGGYIPVSKYEAAALVLLNLCWGEEPTALISRIFNPKRAVFILGDEHPITATLISLADELEFSPASDLIDELAEIGVPIDPYQRPELRKHLIYITGLMAQHELGDAIEYCMECYEEGR